MINFVHSSNLPQNTVSKIICGTQDSRILSFFAKNNIEVLGISENCYIDPSVSLHADMAAVHIGDNRIVIDKAQRKLVDKLTETGFNVITTTDFIKGSYPDDVKLNFTVINNLVVGNFRYADKNFKEAIFDKNKINVKQGYCKCSVLVVNENALITDDESIYRKTLENGFDSLLISKGDIRLEGHKYGFIGGASGKISKNTVVFFGNIKKHRDFDKIEHFLGLHNCDFVCTDNGPLRDIGGIIPLSE